MILRIELRRRMTSVLLWIVLISVGVPLSIMDIISRRLPNPLNLALFVLSAIIISISGIVDHASSRVISSFIDSLVLSISFLIVSFATRGGMGMGDVKLSAGIGLIAGFYGTQTLFLSTFLSFILGALVGVALLLLRKGNLKTTLPFGPFMIIGQLVAMWVAR